MFNNIVLKINILLFMTGFLTEILSVHPQSPDGDSPLLRGATPFLPPSPGDLSQATGLLLNR